MSKAQIWLGLLLLACVAVGSCWMAYEQHMANTVTSDIFAPRRASLPGSL